MSDVVGTSINHEPPGALESSKISNNAQEQEVNDLSEFLKLEHSKYTQYKIIYDTLEEYISENSDVNISLKNKIKDIMLSANVVQSITLDGMLDESSASVLGSCDINHLELNYTERNQLQDVLKSKLDQKYKDIGSGFSKLTGTDINKTLGAVQDAVPLQISPEDKVLIDYKTKLICEQELYVKNLLSLHEILKEISNLRLKKLPQTTEQKIKECQVEEKMNNLKSLLAQEKVRIDVFMETNNSLRAYRQLIKDIKEQQQDCQKEIEDLNELKEKYRQVSCKQYDDILKSYLQYKSSFEKKKLLYDCLKS